MRPSAPLLSAARAAAPAVVTTATTSSPATPPSSTAAGQKKKATTGRYRVGVVDFELDDGDRRDGGGGVASSPSTSTAASPPPPPSSALDHSSHLVGSLYYPAASPSPQKAHRWSPTLYHTHAYVSFASRMSIDHGTFSRRVKTAALAAASHGVLLATGTRVAADAGRAAPPLKEEDGSEAPFGAVVFSHGLGGSRAAYSAFAASLASSGFAVLAIEHADGTAAVAKLAGARGFRDYERWQPGPEQLRARGEARRSELAAAARVWQALAAPPGGGRGGGDGGGAGSAGARAGGGGGGGGDPPLRGLSLEGGRLPLDFFVGAVRPAPGDGRGGALPAVVGHSFGAALAADAAAGGGGGGGGGAGLSRFSAAVCLDPWWGALPEDSAAGSPAPSPPKAPLFVLGSDAWNTPDAGGEVTCGGEAQERVLGSFARASAPSPPSSSRPSSTSSPGNGGGGGGGSGAVFAVLRGSSHAGFSDVVSLLPGLSKFFYGRRRRRAEAAAGEGGGAAAAERDSGAVTEARDPISTARAAAEMTAAFLRRRGAAGGGGAVTEEDMEAVAAAARSVGVELRGLKVV